ncbi:hypothetical protein J3S85_25745 [Streptomyces lavenduligriseus]|uniref:hypothetical protein n=1 Tax=Streptomyces eurythermus TaxID=42237 RepID=UPI00279B8FEE|nr:hypothetical protein J3S85_25745 [Streptomyces lavenduligriseus]
MKRADERLLRRRAYGADHDDPDPGPLPHRTYADSAPSTAPHRHLRPPVEPAPRASGAVRRARGEAR